MWSSTQTAHYEAARQFWPDRFVLTADRGLVILSLRVARGSNEEERHESKQASKQASGQAGRQPSLRRLGRDVVLFMAFVAVSGASCGPGDAANSPTQRDRAQSVFPPLEGERGTVDCGLQIFQHTASPSSDPCAGIVLVESFRLERGSGEPTEVSQVFGVPEDGFMCVKVESGGATSATVLVNGTVTMAPSAFRPHVQQAARVVPVHGGTHTLEARLAGRPGTWIEITVRFVPVGPPPANPSTGASGILTVQNLMHWPAPFSPHRDRYLTVSAQALVKRVAGLQNVGDNQAYHLRYLLQLADELTCKQVRSFGEEVTIDRSGAVSGLPPGYLTESLALEWDGRRDDGARAMAGEYLYRLAVVLVKKTPGGAETVLDSVISGIQRLQVVNHCDADADLALAVECGGTDCDDSDPQVRPEAPELQDGKDNNCNGIIDETDGWVREVERQDSYGFTHERYQFFMGGVHVLGAQRTRHAKDGIERFVSRDTSLNLDPVPTTPTLSAEEAVESFKNHLIAELASIMGGVDPQWRDTLNAYHFRVTGTSLRVFDLDVYLETSTHPTYLVYLVPYGSEMFLVDAHTGSVVHQYPLILNARDRRIHDGTTIADGRYCSVAFPELPGPQSLDEGGGTHSDAEVNDAHEHTGQFYDFVSATFNRDSWDGRGSPLVATVHGPIPTLPDDPWEALFCQVLVTACLCEHSGKNAYWTPETFAALFELPTQQTVFGDGFGVKDVVAHEFGHGLVESSSALSVMTPEPAALHEALADFFAVLIDTPDYEIAEDVAGVGPVRDMADPTRFSHPDNYDDFRPGRSAHANAGIVNKAHYLMIEGTPDFLGVSVQAVGREKVQQVVYLAITEYLVSSASMRDYALGTIAACSQLRLAGAFQIGSADCAAILHAWIAVRVLPAGFPTVNCGLPSDLPTIQDAINIAVHGSTVGICAGTYFENLLVADKSVSLFALEGAMTAVVDGSGTKPVLTLVSAPSPVQVFGLVLQNGGESPQASGAGIQAFSSYRLELEQVLVSSNAGSGISVLRTDLRTDLSTIEFNMAEVGGGIHSTSSVLELRRTNVRYNTANTGGGIRASLGAVVLDESVIFLNTAGSRGGGLHVFDCVVDVVGSSVMLNEAGLSGGGIWIGFSSIVFDLEVELLLRSVGSVWLNVPDDVSFSTGDSYDFWDADFVCPVATPGECF